MEKQRISRKEFLQTAAAFVAGASAGMAGLSLGSTEKRNTAQWPYPYQELDPEQVRILGHDSFWKYGCSYGAFHAIIQALRDKVGEPFTLMPTEMFIYGKGGTAEWGTLCGALNGSAAAICLVTDNVTSEKLIDELLGWYTQTDFPSTISNDYAVNHRYGENRYDQALPQNAAGSPLCHVSVTEWCVLAKFGATSLERKERCARLTGDVAAYAVELLNLNLRGQFTPVYIPPETIAACMTCHGPTALNNVKARMECTQCHGDPHKPLSVRESDESPASFHLYPNYPNPFNPATSIRFSLPQPEKVHLAIYDLGGRLVRTLVNHELYSPGLHTLTWDGKDDFGRKVASGVYFSKVRAGKFVATRKMTLVK